MTTNEIKTLIQNTIAGQGSQVDIGGKLAEILGAIVDAMPASNDLAKVLTIPNYTGVTIRANSKEQFCELAGISVEQYDGLFAGEYQFVKLPNSQGREEKNLIFHKADNGTVWVSVILDEDADALEIVNSVQLFVAENVITMSEY